MPNIQQIVTSHNKAILKPRDNADSALTRNTNCNCRDKTMCPLDGNCLTTSLVYQATVKGEGKKEETYVGLTEGTFKKRYANHKSDFGNPKKPNYTELSKYI